MEAFAVVTPTVSGARVPVSPRLIKGDLAPTTLEALRVPRSGRDVVSNVSVSNTLILAAFSAATALKFPANFKKGRSRKIYVQCRAETNEAAVAWPELLKEAEALNKEKKHFDGIQKINMCMELFEADIGSSDSKILKEPTEFIEEFQAKMSPEQKAAAFKMFSCRGDLLIGLGATRNAAVQYAAAAALQPAEEGIEAKLANVKKLAKVEPDSDGRIPCSVLTGFLGSGKTTLLNHILEANHGRRIAVIENEFGEVGIDDKLVKGGVEADGDETIIEMNNGCICCTVRGDLIAGLKTLCKNARKSNQPLDAVIIETTGLADPAPVAQTFFADPFVQSQYYLDGFLTLVDAHHIIQRLDEEKPVGVVNEAVSQIAFADRILLNKCDLVHGTALDEVEKRISMINQAVPIQRTTNSEVPMDYILGIQAFSLDRIMDIDNAFLSDVADAQHDESVTSVGIHVNGEVYQKTFNEWIALLLMERGADIFRTKGILAVKGMAEKYVSHSIHMIFEGSPQKAWQPGEKRECKIVFIGKNLNREELTTGFMKCMVAEQSD